MKSITIYKIKRILAHIRFKFIIQTSFKNSKKCKEIEGNFSGQRVFIIANGPSLNKTPLYLLKGENILCFNRINLMLERLNFTPNMYMVVDDLLGSDMVDEIKEMISITEHSFFPRVQFGTNITNFKKFYGNNPKIKYLYIHSKQLTSNTFEETIKKGFPWTIIGRTVTVAGLQTMMHLGFSEIYIVGLDMNYVLHKSSTIIGASHAIQSDKDDDPNHFDPRYFGKGRKYHQPVEDTVMSMFNSFEILSAFAKKNGYRIYNATIGGKVECFERINIFELLKEKNAESIFAKLIVDKSGLVLGEIINENIVEPEFFNTINLDHFNINETDIEEAIKKCINDYIPFGPYLNKYILINRKIIK